MENYTRTDKYEYKTGEFNITPDVEDNDFTPLINYIIYSESSCLIDENSQEVKLVKTNATYS